MKHVLTLIGNPEAQALDGVLARRVAAALARRGARPAAADWLSPGRAVDLPFEGAAPGAALAAARAATAGLPVDLHAQARARRRKRLLVADMDSTMVGVETLDELADRIGRRDEVAAITAAAMAGEVDYAGALAARTRLFAGLSLEVLAAVHAERVAPNPGAAELVATMRAAGAVTVLVSGGFEGFVARVAAELGFHAHHANRPAIEDGRLTGALDAPILDGDAKVEILRRTARAHAIDLADAMAIGDGANDAALIEAAGLGIGYRPKPVLAARADMRIDHTDLRTPLYLQGFRDGDIVGGTGAPARGGAERDPTR